jgi:hypothetical protein
MLLGVERERERRERTTRERERGRPFVEDDGYVKVWS